MLITKTMINITDKTFESKVIKSKVPVLVDFWASWCGPCKTMLPIIDEIAEEFGSKIVVAKVDIEKDSLKADEYQVKSLPTFLIFKDGDVVEQFYGVASKEKIVKALKKHI